MSESKKLVIGFAVVGTICLCMAGVGLWGLRSFGDRIDNLANGDPTSVAQIQDKIAEFDVPPGYKTQAMSMFVYDIVYLVPDSGDGPTIMMMRYGSLTGNQEQMEQQLRQAAEQQNRQPGMAMKVVDTFEKVIRGESVTVTVSEADHQGFTMRQWMTVFNGNDGLVVMMIQGPVEDWNDELIENFIASIQ